MSRLRQNEGVEEGFSGPPRRRRPGDPSNRIHGRDSKRGISVTDANFEYRKAGVGGVDSIRHQDQTKYYSRTMGEIPLPDSRNSGQQKVRIRRVAIALTTSVAAALALWMIPDFSINSLPLLLGLVVLSISGVILLLQGPAWLISSLLGGRGLTRAGFRMPLFGKFLFIVQLAAMVYGLLTAIERSKQRR